MGRKEEKSINEESRQMGKKSIRGEEGGREMRK